MCCCILLPRHSTQFHAVGTTTLPPPPPVLPPLLQVSGTVRIVDDCTFEVYGFTYDGQGPKVWWWGAPSTDNGDIRSEGRRIVPGQLTRGYDGETVGGSGWDECMHMQVVAAGVCRKALRASTAGSWCLGASDVATWERPARLHLSLICTARRLPAARLAALPGRRPPSPWATASRLTTSRSSACGVRSSSQTLGTWSCSRVRQGGGGGGCGGAAGSVWQGPAGSLGQGLSGILR